MYWSSSYGQTGYWTEVWSEFSRSVYRKDMGDIYFATKITPQIYIENNYPKLHSAANRKNK